MGGVFGRWGEIVGEQVAVHVQPIRLDGGRLVVEVSDPAWATQMRLLTDRVRQRIHDVTGTTVDTVEVRVAGRGKG
jgi:predicted nucleic acid-binding Zn ribbon protein